MDRTGTGARAGGGVIRVCLVAPAHMTGGQAIEAKTLVNGFAEDPDVRVELQPIDPQLPTWLARIRGLRTIARMPVFLVGLFRRVARADVVHVFTAAFWPFLLTTTPAILIGRAFGKPIVLNYRDGRAADHIGRPWVRWVINRVALLVFPSGFLQEVFRKFGYEGVVVANVVDTMRFQFRERTPLRPVLLSCRLLEALYDVDNTIAAYRVVKRWYPDAALLIIGDGDQRTRLEAFVRQEGIEGVEFHGAVSHDEVPAFFDRADVLVNSSRIDNMPHSLIEAFAAGMPIVTTPAGGIPYIVQDDHNGLYAKIDDPRSMADAIGRLLEEPGLAAQLVAQGRIDCEERYSWRAASMQWKTHYSHLTQGSVERRAEVGVSSPTALRSAPHD